MFIPNRVIFEKDAFNYPLGNELFDYFQGNKDIKVIEAASNRIKSHIPGDDLSTQYKHGKKTLVVGIKKSLKFLSCKPSAHYQLPLVSGCMGQCEYCYLNTQLGDKPFIKAHVNIDEILAQAKKYITERSPDITIFEGAATSDPVPIEPYTHGLEKAINFFANEELARFRFVTKFTDIDSLLPLNHNNHTEIRFSLNTEHVISSYEHGTASAKLRIEASSKLAAVGYPIGFIIAPVFIYPNWKEEYHNLLINLRDSLPKTLSHPVIFEVISHRYTTKAKNRILQIFPQTTLPMDEADRKYKYGQFGYGKYVYPKEELQEMKDFFTKEFEDIFPYKNVKYII